jgi:hypothetical protein
LPYKLFPWQFRPGKQMTKQVYLYQWRFFFAIEPRFILWTALLISSRVYIPAFVVAADACLNSALYSSRSKYLIRAYVTIALYFLNFFFYSMFICSAIYTCIVTLIAWVCLIKHVLLILSFDIVQSYQLPEVKLKLDN